MKSSELRGFRSVYRFTLIETLKSRAFLISMLIMLLGSAISLPVISLVKGDFGTEDGDVTANENVFYDEVSGESLSDILIHISDETADLFGGVSYTDLGFSWESIRDKAGDTEVQLSRETAPLTELLSALDKGTGNEVLISLSLNGLGISLTVYRGADTAVSEDVGQQIADYYTEKLTEFKDELTELTEAERKLLDSDISVVLNFTDENGQVATEKDTTISGRQYTLGYAAMMLVMMAVLLSSTQVATSVATDKSTKVVEYLMTSVRPMALVVGKVLAMLTLAAGQLTLMVVLLLSSNRLSSGSEGGLLKQFLGNDAWKNVSVPHLLVCLLSLCLGTLMFGMLAALCGASVSKMEALQEALSTLTIITCVGIYLGVIAMGVMLDSGDSAYVIFAELFPLSSAFLIPGAVLIGKVSVPVMLGAFAILIAADLFLFLFVARVYELLINHNGERIHPKEWLTFYKISRKGGKLV